MPEQIVIFALFLRVALVNWLVRWLRSRMEERPPVEQPARRKDVEDFEDLRRRFPPSRPVPTPPRAPEPVTLESVAPERVRLERVVPALTVPLPSAIATEPVTAATRRLAPVRRRSRFRVGGPAELRRAVVLMTVLGPCRAVDVVPSANVESSTAGR